ncbi:gibberellin 2-beta-dioxygenase, partial [Tanacetum coccineum]
MVIHKNPLVKPCIANSAIDIPVVDLSCPHEAKKIIVDACQDYGFFKVINHGVPIWLVSELENEAIAFFNMNQSVKDKYCPPNPLGYGSNIIGRNGDVGWIEYLLLNSNNFPSNRKILSTLAKQYVAEVKKLGCEILELMADGLKIEPRSVLSRMLNDDKADTVFRLNHYPPYLDNVPMSSGRNLIGFGEHTDPQLISIARSNATSGLQICLHDGTWVPVPPDHNSFFVNVDDLLQ